MAIVEIWETYCTPVLTVKYAIRRFLVAHMLVVHAPIKIAHISMLHEHMNHGAKEKINPKGMKVSLKNCPLSFTTSELRINAIYLFFQPFCRLHHHVFCLPIGRWIADDPKCINHCPQKFKRFGEIIVRQ